MKNEFTYDPEDLESLMMHKSFIELYPEERSFVLKHMSSSEEYESMRNTLFAIQQSNSSSDRISMPPSSKDKLMDAYRAEHKKERKFMLNGVLTFLFPTGRSWIQKPAFQLAMIVVVCVGGFFLYSSSNTNNHTLAELDQRRPAAKKEVMVPKTEEQSSFEPNDALPNGEVETEEQERSESNEEEVNPFELDALDIPAEEELLVENRDLLAALEEEALELDADDEEKKEIILSKDADHLIDVQTASSDFTSPQIDTHSTQALTFNYSTSEDVPAYAEQAEISVLSSAPKQAVAERLDASSFEVQSINSADISNVYTLLEAAY